MDKPNKLKDMIPEGIKKPLVEKVDPDSVSWKNISVYAKKIQEIGKKLDKNAKKRNNFAVEMVEHAIWEMKQLARDLKDEL